MEPPRKLIKLEELDLKEMLLTMQSSIMIQLKSIEDKVEKMSSKYHVLEERIENIWNKVKDATVTVPYPGLNVANSDCSLPNLLACNLEESYPDGSWLGDPNNPGFRVRCAISPIDLENINSTCPTAEKMALTLLDYLFDRETQAISNISGTGKHGKKRLDPVKIYGIKCHAKYHFEITDKDWLKIRQNLDSKCRTAFRRKLKGMPLTVKGCRERMLQNSSKRLALNINENSSSEIGLTSNQQLESSKLGVQELNYVNQDLQVIPIKLETAGCSVTFTADHAQIIHTEHGDIQVIQTTEEQLEQLKRNHHVEILSHADVLTEQVLESAG